MFPRIAVNFIAAIAVVAYYNASTMAQLDTGSGARLQGRVTESSLAVLRQSLMTALGPSFQYVGGDVRICRVKIGDSDVEPFWFARVRATAAGEFPLTYLAQLEKYPSHRQVFVEMYIEIGKKGGQRRIVPGALGGSARPTGNVGDTIVVPIDLGPSFGQYKFGLLSLPDAAIYLSLSPKFLFSDKKLEAYHPHLTPGVTFRNDAMNLADIVDGFEQVNLPTIPARRLSVWAQVTLRTQGDFSLYGRLIGPNQKYSYGSTVHMHVVPRDKGVAANATAFFFTPNYGPNPGKLQVIVPPETTFEAHIGDGLVLNCGSFNASPPPSEPRGWTAIITTQPPPSTQPSTPN